MSIFFGKTRFLVGFAVFTASLFVTSCGFVSNIVNNVTTVVGLAETATVISARANIRSSFAVVASDLLEVKRGDVLDVLDENEFEKVLWYRVRARDEDKTEGWIEAQHIITGAVLEKSKKLSEEMATQPVRATGDLRNVSNLRLTPEIGDKNTLLRLAAGSTFQIIDAKYVEKPPVVEDPNKPKSTAAQEIELAKEDNKPPQLDEKYDVWFLVRLDPSVSPAPAGWLFGRQVEYKVPADILFYQSNDKKFVGWARFDGDEKEGEKQTPGSWIILTRSNTVKAIDGVEPDYDGILILAFDKYDQGHYTVWKTTGEVWGKMPMVVEGTGDSKTIRLSMRSSAGSMDEKRLTLVKDKNRYRLTPPEDFANYEKKPER